MENCQVPGEIRRTEGGALVQIHDVFFLSLQVKSWPSDQYGQFYNGDSYIVLNTYKEKDSEVSIAS